MTTNDITRGPWKALLIHEGYAIDDFSELDSEDEVDIRIARDSALPDSDGDMPGSYKSGDVALDIRDIYVEDGDPNTDAPAVYERAKLMAAGLNGAAEVERLHAELEKVRAQLTAARAERDEYAHDNRRVVAQLTAANHHTDNLAADVRDMQKANTAYANENARLRSKLADQQPVINAAQDWRELRKSCPKTPNADALLRGAVDRLQSSQAEVAR